MDERFDFDEFKGVIRDKYWLSDEGNNGAPFKKLGVNRFDYCSKIVAHSVDGGGDFPWLNNRSEVLKVCLQLKKDLEMLRSPMSDSSNTIKEGDKVILTHSDHNFNDIMEAMVGKTVTVTSVSNNDTITFDGDEGFFWNKSEGHFKTIDKSPIIPTDTGIGEPYTLLGKTGILERNREGNWYWYLDDSYKFVGEIFRRIGISTNQFSREILGYDKGGIFPFSQTKSDFLKLCAALTKAYEKACDPPTIVSMGDTIKIGTYSGIVQNHPHGIWWTSGGGIFDRLGINKEKFQRSVLGYYLDGGFPFCKNLQDFEKFINAISKEYDEKYPDGVCSDISYKGAVLPTTSCSREPEVKPILISVPSI